MLTTVGRLCLVVGWLLVVTTAQATDRTHDITLEDYFTQSFLTGCAVSPNGDWVAYTELRWQEPDDPRNQDLWVVHTQTRQVRRLTFDNASDHSPQWGKESRWVYFLSSRKRGSEDTPPHNGKTQIWRISVDGGSVQPITRLKKSVQQFEIAADGNSVYYTLESEQRDEPWKDLRKKYENLIYGHGIRKASELWKLDLTHWRAEKVWTPDRYIRDFALSPDGSHIAAVTTPDDQLVTHEGWSQVDIYDLAKSKSLTLDGRLWREEAPSPYGWIESLAWSQDSKLLAFRVDFDGYPAQLYAAKLSEKAPEVSSVVVPDNITVGGGGLQWDLASRLVFVGEQRARSRVYAAVLRDNVVVDLTPGDIVVSDYHLNANGRLAFVAATPTRSEDIYLAASNKSRERLTKINPQVDHWKLPQISLVRWNAPDGVEVEGVLELPPDYKEGDGPLPMVVVIHGGPTSATPYSFRFWMYGRTLFASKGYAMLSPNYRGSTGYGSKFLTDLIGRENDIEVKDILAGVDAMVEREIADPKRLAVMGWSNGGYLTNGIISTTDRFKAASSGAGVLDQFMQWALEDTPGHVINYMGAKLPWSGREVYAKASPSYKLDQVTTPTLIHVGENDARVPAAHSRTLHRALRTYLNVPTELIIYPGEGHGLSKYKHRKAKMEWDHAWFDKYLGK